MSRSTKTLKRLGVPSLAAVTLVAGLPLFLGTAQAAHINSISLNPEAQTGSAGACLPFTVQVNFATAAQATAETVDVVITEGGTASATQDVNFCTLTTLGSDAPQSPTGATDTGAAGTSDRAEFRTNAAGKVTFGVTANLPGTVNVQAFYETDNNNVFNAGEFQDTSVATITTGGPAGSNANQDAATRVEVLNSSSDTATATTSTDTDGAVEGETRTFRVFVGGAAGSRLNGVIVNAAINSDVDSADRASFVFGTTDNNGIVTGTVTFPARTEVGTSTTSTDTVTFFVNQTGTSSTPGLDSTEPRDTVAVTVTSSAAQQNRTVTLAPAADGTNTTNPAVNRANDGNRQFVATVDAADGQPSTAGTLLAFGVTGGSGDETVVPNEPSTSDNAGGTDTNDSSVTVTVNDPTPTVGQTLTVTVTIRGTSAAATSTLTFRNDPSDARSVVLTPETVTVAPNTAQQLTATVRDVDGNPVQGVVVRFTETGPGAFRNGNSEVFATTNAQGVATVETISLPGETGTQTVTADIRTAATGQANQATLGANTGTDPQGNALNTTTNTGAAGVGSDSSTVTFGTVTPSPSPSATGTTGPTPRPSNTAGPVDCRVTPTVTLNPSTIIATGSAGVTVNAPANSEIELLAYSQPSTTYRVVRRALIDAAGAPAQFRVVPPTNTRLYAQIVGCDTDETRFSVVLNVRTQLSLNVERLGKQTYRFSGDSLPARAGGLIVSLYRVTDDGRQILTAQDRANALGTANAGEYSIDRRFTGTGRFGFVVRTGQDLQNAPGASNVRSLLIF